MEPGVARKRLRYFEMIITVSTRARTPSFARLLLISFVFVLKWLDECLCTWDQGVLWYISGRPGLRR